MGRRTLHRIYRRFLSEIAPIDSMLAHDPAVLGRHEFLPAYDYGREMAPIRLQDAWARFCREVIVESAYARPITFTGVVLDRARGFRSRTQVLRTLTTLYPKKHASDWEPDWSVPQQAISAARKLGIRNLATVSGAIGSTPSPLEDLRNFRNFFAHRSGWRAIRIRKLARSESIPKDLLARDVLSHDRAPRKQLLLEWKEQLDLMAQAAIQ